MVAGNQQANIDRALSTFNNLTHLPHVKLS